MQVEHVDFFSVLTKDLERAQRFSAALLGLDVHSESGSNRRRDT